MGWHLRTIEETIAELNSSSQGLFADDARQRLDEYGPNELQEQARRTPVAMLLSQFTDFMILILMGAAVLAAVIGDLGDAMPIIAIVILNAVIGFVQEFRAERAMAALREMAGNSATVMRDGSPVAIPAREIVPGDLVLLEAGNVVPADLRLVEAAQLKAVEAALTGESLPVEKVTEPFADPDLSLGDRRNMAYKGTVISYGRGAGIAVTTGMGTELGRIATMLQNEEETRTPLQKRLAVFGQRLAVAILIVCAIIFTLGFLRENRCSSCSSLPFPLRWPPVPRRFPQWSPSPLPWAPGRWSGKMPSSGGFRRWRPSARSPTSVLTRPEPLPSTG